MLSAVKMLILPNLFLFSVLCSYYDIKYRKIPNWLLKRMILVGSGITLLYLLYFGGIGEIAIYILISAVVGAGLWLMGFWCPGDAKFYFGLSLLSPALCSVPLIPPTVSMVSMMLISIVYSIVEGKIGFSFKFQYGMLLPLATIPVFSFIKSNLISFWIAMFLSSVVKPEKIRGLRKLLLSLCFINFLLYQRTFLKLLLMVLLISLLNSIKLEGTLPSAPFLGASFIYSSLFFMP